MENTSRGKRLAKGFLNGLMEASMRVSFLMTNFMAKGFMCEKLEKNTTGTESKGKCMEKATFFGQMEGNPLESSAWTLSMELESTFELMEKCLLEDELMIKCMESGSFVYILSKFS